MSENAASSTAMARCMWMRGGSSKGGYFLAEDLPEEEEARNGFLLRVMGSPDTRQIDGMGGGDPLTSKVAVVKKSHRENVDVDYLFLQVFVDQAIVTDAQNCGNILAGVGAFAIERGLVCAEEGETRVSIYMENTGQIAHQVVQTPNGTVCYRGEARVDGVPGTAAAIRIQFENTQGSTCGALFPTGSVIDVVDGIEVTCVDNGMPLVLIRAEDLGLSGEESRDELDAHVTLKSRLESIRLQIGPEMNLGNVSSKSVPKMVLVSPARQGGAVSTRSFIPHRCHAAIGVFAAVTVATACQMEGTVAAVCVNQATYQNSMPNRQDGGVSQTVLGIEHPSGQTDIVLNTHPENGLVSAEVISSARKLFDGCVFAN